MWFKLALKLSGRNHSALIPLIDFYIELVASIHSTGIGFTQCDYVILVLPLLKQYVLLLYGIVENLFSA